MGTSVTIQSVRDSTRLTFSDAADDSFTAALAGSHFSGQVTVSNCYGGPPSLLFDEMARDWKGWRNDKTWTALEGELALTASSDRLGHVALLVVMHDCWGAADWRLGATLHVEAGRLDELARLVRSAFGENGRSSPT